MGVSEGNCGIYKVRGTCRESSLTLNGSAHFLTEDLLADSVYVSHGGIGNCNVYATRVLAGEILLNGTMRYKNHPGLKVLVEKGKGVLVAF